MKWVKAGATVGAALAVGVGGLTPAGTWSAQASTADAAVELVAPQADEETRRIAAEDPQAVQTMATRCGDGYNVIGAEQLPYDGYRLGTLFRYSKKTSGGNWRYCMIFDNNTGSTKYMRLRTCEYTLENPECRTDQGDFSQYAGPVYTGLHWKYPQCSKVVAIMKNSKDSDKALIDAVRTANTCN
ncbi:hypothetical protein OG946_29690 [Streptomyces sp. NBC_01808]|uniref:hypothetical protein n=1 Tax=Streptomyces sp. NBC_01808 TaxID=2975947 RepID=UPI002DDAB124|nr:hypothetical protein [Streptomyces sp. NBC_01808]WSA41185.1 hypothetical protein OG946_29690 [Streptomyces sp. NBC_01808]